MLFSKPQFFQIENMRFDGFEFCPFKFDLSLFQVIAAAKPGEVLIAVADSVGIHIPRGCMTGLCGACTCDMEDLSFPGNRGILRACSTLVSNRSLRDPILTAPPVLLHN
jgi:hypothetical protein